MASLPEAATGAKSSDDIAADTGREERVEERAHEEVTADGQEGRTLTKAYEEAPPPCRADAHLGKGDSEQQCDVRRAHVRKALAKVAHGYPRDDECEDDCARRPPQESPPRESPLGPGARVAHDGDSTRFSSRIHGEPSGSSGAKRVRRLATHGPRSPVSRARLTIDAVLAFGR